jgi:flavodoxin I
LAARALFHLTKTQPSLDYDVGFSGKKVACFGCGDQNGYLDNVLDVIGLLENH